MILELLLVAATVKPDCMKAQAAAIEAVREAWVPSLDLDWNLAVRTLECGCDCIYDEAAKYSCMALKAQQKQDARTAQLAKEKKAQELLDAADVACGRAKKYDDGAKPIVADNGGATESIMLAHSENVTPVPPVCSHKETEELGAVSIAGEAVRLSIKRCKKCGVLMGGFP